MHILLPLAAAVLFALASFLFKRAFQEGANTRQVFHISNLLTGLLYCPLLALEAKPIPWADVWQPIVVGLCIFGGGFFTLAGIRRADVSLVTPLLGTKAVLVAVGTVLITSVPVSPRLWAAAGLTTAGIILLGYRDLKVDRRGSLVAMALALLSASLFAVADVLMSKWASAFGAWSFIALLAVALPALTLLAAVLEPRPMLRLPRRRLGWLVAGGVVLSLQSMMIAVALGFFGDATRVNVVYSSRGLWALVLAPVAARWLGVSEEGAARGALPFRAAGTAVLILAVVLALW